MLTSDGHSLMQNAYAHLKNTPIWLTFYFSCCFPPVRMKFSSFSFSSCSLHLVIWGLFSLLGGVFLSGPRNVRGWEEAGNGMLLMVISCFFCFFLSWFHNLFCFIGVFHKIGIKNWVCWLAFHRKEWLSKSKQSWMHTSKKGNSIFRVHWILSHTGRTSI